MKASLQKPNKKGVFKLTYQLPKDTFANLEEWATDLIKVNQLLKEAGKHSGLLQPEVFVVNVIEKTRGKNSIKIELDLIVV